MSLVVGCPVFGATQHADAALLPADRATAARRLSPLLANTRRPGDLRCADLWDPARTQWRRQRAGLRRAVVPEGPPGAASRDASSPLRHPARLPGPRVLICARV